MDQLDSAGLRVDITKKDPEGSTGTLSRIEWYMDQ